MLSVVARFRACGFAPEAERQGDTGQTLSSRIRIVTWMALLLLAVGVVGAPFLKTALAQRGVGRPIAYGAGFALLAVAALTARAL